MEICIGRNNLVQPEVSAFVITHKLFINSGVRELRFAQANPQFKNWKIASLLKF